MKSLDARTHLLVLLCASLLSVLVSQPVQTDLLASLCLVYMLFNHLPRKALQYGLIYITLKVVYYVLITYNLGTFVIIVYTFVKLMPMAMIGVTLISMSPSALMCAYAKMRVPNAVLVMLCILLRFFPVLQIEIRAIRDGIRARGIFPRWYSAAAQPAIAYECFFMPLIVRCLKLSAELASSAELRGIESGCMRTSIHPVGIKVADGLTVGIYVLLGASIYWVGGFGT
ncbi:energy-coupling factor transporter transmembrane protein EcfT [Paenibacillus sp. ACRRX]|uniref:energy-coupling factor transporter transmembrane component T family protein n=1 Tax=Paenibacillus sp. ACRRX TaxID=2918206 RepID=UPI001EF740B5|nr:energy-coupling factor transporter transmembrane component T [Paenibacillus sp. ACRRX]MCG7409843.1 energy-coupling factor transporter transmembrane protein EcfT [Paenibacillus sp. ACRRX]